MTVFSVLPDLLVTIPAFLLLLTFVVFVHEAGHFYAARLLGVRVDIFSVGFGKPLFSRTDRAGTQWRIARWPLGGYIKFSGDPGMSVQEPRHGDNGSPTRFPRSSVTAGSAGMSREERASCFHFKPVWARALIVAAGPVANFILAVLVFTFLYATLGRVEHTAVAGYVVPDSPAMEAGIMPGDIITSIDDRPVNSFRQVSDYVIVSGGQPLAMGIDRDGRSMVLDVTPQRARTEDHYGNAVENWMIGIRSSADGYRYVTYSFPEAFAAGVRQLFRIITMTVRFTGRIVLGQEDVSQLGGPVKIAQYAGQSALSGFNMQNPGGEVTFGHRLQSSLIDFLSLAAIISASIGFLNLLPLPVLDGGYLAFYAYEAVAGKPLAASVQAAGFRIGIVLLASFMVFVTWNDIYQIFGSISG